MFGVFKFLLPFLTFFSVSFGGFFTETCKTLGRGCDDPKEIYVYENYIGTLSDYFIHLKPKNNGKEQIDKIAKSLQNMINDRINITLVIENEVNCIGY